MPTSARQSATSSRAVSLSRTAPAPSQPTSPTTDPAKWAAFALVANAALSIMKALGGILFHSQALLSDAVHSGFDVIADVVVLFAVKWSRRPPSATFPYGYGKIEAMASFMVGVLLFMASYGLLTESLETLYPATLSLFGVSDESQTTDGNMEHEHHHHHEIDLTSGPWAAVLALVSIVVKEILFRYTAWAAKVCGSEALLASAWHHRSDAITSVVALVGSLGTWYNLSILDSAAGFGISLLLFHVGIFEIMVPAILELLDGAGSQEDLSAVRDAVADAVQKTHLERILSVGQVRVRRMGPKLRVEVQMKLQVGGHSRVAAETSLERLLETIECMKQEVVSRIENVGEVSVEL